MPAFPLMNIEMNPRILQSVFEISALVRQHIQVHPKFSPALRQVPKLITITPWVLLYQSTQTSVTPVLVIRDPRYSEDQPECPPTVWYSSEIDALKFTLHILSNTPGVFQRQNYILLMWPSTVRTLRAQQVLVEWGNSGPNLGASSQSLHLVEIPPAGALECGREGNGPDSMYVLVGKGIEAVFQQDIWSIGDEIPGSYWYRNVATMVKHSRQISQSFIFHHI
jgi:hypothetical protein